MRGLIIGGGFGNLIVREKSSKGLELGELFIAEKGDAKLLMQVIDLLYGSQLSQQHLELMSGLKLEEDEELEIKDEKIRHYVLARAKNLLTIKDNIPYSSKELPQFFTGIRDLQKEDLAFLNEKVNYPLMLGNLRSGRKVLDVPVILDGEKTLSHHVLVSGTTGRGKSVLMTNILWNTISQDYCGFLVLDPHDEYYGKTTFGLKDHPEARTRLVYYSPRDAPPGQRTLRINLSLLKPGHFNGVVDWSDAQRQALFAYSKKYHDIWIQSLMREQPIDVSVHEGTLAVIKRQLSQVLNIRLDGEQLVCEGIFDESAGKTTIQDITTALEQGKTVLVDTSECENAVEVLIGSVIATDMLDKYKRMTTKELQKKPIISIVLEEAPRVLGREVLEKGPNIFSTIAREGRKFRVGLLAITQLPSLIPRQILANMNTKIILGIEMKPERQALIESASQDLSEDDRTIASLDKGEALITSNFLKFATPIKIPLIDAASIQKPKQSFREFQ